MVLAGLVSKNYFPDIILAMRNSFGSKLYFVFADCTKCLVRIEQILYFWKWAKREVFCGEILQNIFVHNDGYFSSKAIISGNQLGLS